MPEMAGVPADADANLRASLHSTDEPRGFGSRRPEQKTPPARGGTRVPRCAAPWRVLDPGESVPRFA